MADTLLHPPKHPESVVADQQATDEIIADRQELYAVESLVESFKSGDMSFDDVVDTLFDLDSTKLERAQKINDPNTDTSMREELRSLQIEEFHKLRRFVADVLGVELSEDIDKADFARVRERSLEAFDMIGDDPEPEDVVDEFFEANGTPKEVAEGMLIPESIWDDIHAYYEFVFSMNALQSVPHEDYAPDDVVALDMARRNAHNRLATRIGQYFDFTAWEELGEEVAHQKYREVLAGAAERAYSAHKMNESDKDRVTQELGVLHQLATH